MGNDGQRLHEAANIETDDKTHLYSIWTLFETLFTSETNPRIFSHTVYYTGGPRESMNSYISRCRQHITECSYTDADDQLVDLIISGLRDNVIRGKLFDGKPTDLVKCIEMCLSHEHLYRLDNISWQTVIPDDKYVRQVNARSCMIWQGQIMAVQWPEPYR